MSSLVSPAAVTELTGVIVRQPPTRNSPRSETKSEKTRDNATQITTGMRRPRQIDVSTGQSCRQQQIQPISDKSIQNAADTDMTLSTTIGTAGARNQTGAGTDTGAGGTGAPRLATTETQKLTLADSRIQGEIDSFFV